MRVPSLDAPSSYRKTEKSIWGKSFSCLLLLVIAVLGAMSAGAKASTQLALVGGMLLDGYGGAPTHHAAILLEKNRIVAAGPAADVVIPLGTPVIDTRGETMMPGMIEVHAHLVKAIVEVAHCHHVKVHAHVYEEQAARDAFIAGVDVLQHAGSGMPPFDAALVKQIAESRRPVVLTAAHRIWVLPATREFPERLDDPEIQRGFPPDIWAEMRDSFRRFETLSVFKNREREESFGDASTRQWIRAGAIIGMGTDSGTPLNFHRDALWREAKALADQGMPPARLITALTLVNARILGKERGLGTIEPGKLADITVVKGNPLFDIVALANVDVVIKDGVPYRDSVRIEPNSSGQSR